MWLLEDWFWTKSLDEKKKKQEEDGKKEEEEEKEEEEKKEEEQEKKEEEKKEEKKKEEEMEEEEEEINAPVCCTDNISFLHVWSSSIWGQPQGAAGLNAFKVLCQAALPYVNTTLKIPARYECNFTLSFINEYES